MCPFAWIGSCRVIDPNNHAVLLSWGQYKGTISKEGLYCVNPCGQTLQIVSTKVQTTDFKSVKVIDKNGNPVIMDGVVSWKVFSAKKATLDVQNYAKFVREQAAGAVKMAAGMFPFESTDEPSMRTTPEKVTDAVIHSLQEKVLVAGVKILGFAITDLSYAKEIAQAMLVRQQAEATLKARKIIVEGAVTIASRAIEQLRDNAVELDAQTQGEMVKNLVTVLCSDRGVQPTMGL
jgi:regulator of protease activity HflC (stomatin/prohibitin superfamily)